MVVSVTETVECKERNSVRSSAEEGTVVMSCDGQALVMDRAGMPRVDLLWIRWKLE